MPILYKFIEGAYGNIYVPKPGAFTRGIVLDNTPAAIEDFRSKYLGEDTFTSIFSYNNSPDGKLNPKQKVYGPFYMDISIDNNLLMAQKVTRRVLIELSKYVPLLYIEVQFSGMRGFHIEIAPEIFGIEPCVDLPQTFASMAKEIGKTANVLTPYVSTQNSFSIYKHNQLWRLTNSVHSLSKLYKIPLSSYTAIEYRPDYILTKAKAPQFNVQVPKVRAPIPYAKSFYQRMRSSQSELYA